VKIIVFPNKTKDFYCKPDNTQNRNSSDFFLPDFFNDTSVAISLAVKINKSVKFTSQEFAKRYYSEWGLGITFYPENLIKSTKNFFLAAKILSADNTAFLSERFLPLEEIGKNEYLNFIVDNTLVYNNQLANDILNEINKSIEEASKFLTLKCGDFIFIELMERLPVNIGNHLKLSYSDQTYLDLCIR